MQSVYTSHTHALVACWSLFTLLCTSRYWLVNKIQDYIKLYVS